MEAKCQAGSPCLHWALHEVMPLRHEDVGFPSPVTWRNVLIAPLTGALCDVVGVFSNRKKPQRMQWHRGAHHPAVPHSLLQPSLQRSWQREHHTVSLRGVLQDLVHLSQVTAAMSGSTGVCLSSCSLRERGRGNKLSSANGLVLRHCLINGM